jgi:hypothetical protein
VIHNNKHPWLTPLTLPRLLELSREDRAAHIITQALRKYVWEKKYGRLLQCTHGMQTGEEKNSSMLVDHISQLSGADALMCMQAQC